MCRVHCFPEDGASTIAARPTRRCCPKIPASRRIGSDRETAMPVTFDAAGNVSGALFSRGWGLDYRSTAKAPLLSEDPRIPPDWSAAPGSLFHAGHVVAPWSIFVADDSAEVHLTTARQESPRGAVAVASRLDGNAVVWAGPQAGLFTISGRAGDMRPLAARKLAIDLRYRVDRVPTQVVKIG